jgi:predicted AAA+ superfamily ATPase
MPETDLTVDKVFVAGGLPTVTYVPRTALHLERKVKAYLDSLHKILSIAGPTKSGKTVLLRKVLPKEKAIWISGGEINTIDEFWNKIILKADSFTDTAVTQQSESAKLRGESAEGSLGLKQAICRAI